MRLIARKVPFSYLLMGIIFFIIIILVLAGIWIAYVNSSENLRQNADRLRTMTESNIDNSFQLIDAGLKLYDTAYNHDMEKAFPVVMAEYDRTGGDPSRMDLEALKTAIGGMDVYVINDRCIIEYSTVPADTGLDFAVIYPDFCTYLHNIRNSSGFYPDRVVRDWSTGTLTKYSYMPTPDHRYVMEIGLRSEYFEGERKQPTYSVIVERVKELNPYLDEVLLFQKQKRLIGNSTYVPTPEDHAMLDYILWENRTSQEIRYPELGKTVRWQVIDLRDPEYAADMSIFAKLTFNDALLESELNNLRMLTALIAMLVLLSGGLLAIVVSRKLSRPIEQLVSDVDAIAGGDLDHPVSHVAGIEFSALEKSIQIMVNRLKEDIRKCELSEKRFMDLVQLLPQGVFETDTAGTITFANPAAFELFGYAPGDLERGMTIADVIAPQDQFRAHATLQAIINGQKTEGSEYIGLRKDGRSFPIMVYTAAIMQDGTVTGSRGTIVDISRLKRIEDEIRELNLELEGRVSQRTSELEDATREMEAFTYSVSHDLRAPLRAIDGYSYLLLQEAGGRLSDVERHYLDVLRHNVRQMDDLINGLLNLSRMGRAELKREWISPEPMVREILAGFQNDLEGRGEVVIGDLPPCYADEVMLRQVYYNLISNAVKFTRYTENPRIEIGARTQDGRTVYFIRDNGTGFDMRYVDKLFKPFQRLHTGPEYEGSGIGLAIVYRIIRRHDGKIWAEGDVGRGATFSFTIGNPPA
ncbi:MAG: PAS domain S-box protein [Methanomicrobiales archaeon]|nr:PAS domain S-box protein [Methanomicrobiales archaeon]